MANEMPDISKYYDGDGTTVQFGVTFDYLDKSYVFVAVDGVDVAFTWVTDSVVQLASAPAAGTGNVRVYRSTLASSMVAVFSDDTPFLAKYVDKDYTQLLHLIQEVDSNSSAREEEEAAARDAAIAAEAATRSAADTALRSTITTNWAHTLRTPDVIDAIPYDADERANKMLGFDADGNPRVLIPASGDVGDLVVQLASSAGADMIGIQAPYDAATLESVNDTVLSLGITPQEFGAAADGTTLDTAALSAAFAASPDLYIPAGEYIATSFWVNRGKGESSATTDYTIRGGGSYSSQFLQPEGADGVAIYTDYHKRFTMSGIGFNNDILGAGTSKATSKNGAIWTRYAEDGVYKDMWFSGSDCLTWCLDNCDNMFAYDMKVDFQYRYPTGYSKSPLIVGDSSRWCQVIGGYVKAVGRNGDLYGGDLADNDNAYDGKWCNLNLLGLPYATKTNGNACMWSEGNSNDANYHVVACNMYGNGVGHGISEKLVATGIGNTIREAQTRGVWNSGSTYFGIGNHYMNNTGLYNPGNSNILAAIHHDNSMATISMGSFFRGNTKDFSDYTGGTTTTPGNTMQSIGDISSAQTYIGSSGVTDHVAVLGGLQTIDAYTQHSGKGHYVAVGTSIVGYLGAFGANSSGLVSHFYGCSMLASTYGGGLLTQVQLGKVVFENCVIRGYYSIMAAYADRGLVVFKNCTFANCTFSSTDLECKYINCEFVSCTNPPSSNGRNFKVDSEIRPTTVSLQHTFAAGGTVSLPRWAVPASGIHRVLISSSTEGPCGEYTIYRTAANISATATAVTESATGAFTVSWPTNGGFTIAAATAGTYDIRIV